MDTYEPQKIEKKWQEAWEASGIYKAEDKSQKPKWYSLFEFPYPSGDGLHVGHLRPYVGMDLISRKRRMEGFNVLYPIGWDAFGLPTENYAIKHGLDPAVASKKNTQNFKRQIQSVGISLDWSREIDTTDPEYYRWTQWMFLQFFKKGLAYKTKTFINWCPKDKIGLANEEAAGGVCDRCGGPVEKREKDQWMIAITKYADKLLEGLKDVDYIPRARVQQENWIGRSEGAEIEFRISNEETSIKVFTTRPDTILGVTYVVIAPEHPLMQKLEDKIKNLDEVRGYIASAKRKSEMERSAEDKQKTGVPLSGITVTHPITKEQLPVWTADYVLSSYGTGAIMAVPDLDERDRAFAQAHQLPIVSTTLLPFDEVVSKTGGTKTVKYKLRDWVFSRQRYWGEPIPLVYCPSCAETSAGKENAGWIAVPDDQLPVTLPKVEKYQPTDTGESPLANISEWVNTTCPNCKGPARRETDTMPNWAGSSWYFLRYTDPHNSTEFASKENLKQWMPIDWYNGGMEHTVLHLLYSRFWNRFLSELGLVPVAEPYKKRTSHGLILAAGGVKMSKSKGNVVNPDTLVAEFGADALRLYEMFIGPFDQPVAWDERGVLGTERFLQKVWRIKPGTEATSSDILRSLHRTIKKVGHCIETMSFNTAVSAMMVFINELGDAGTINTSDYQKFLQILAPFAPHITEELWHQLGNKDSIHLSGWPQYDETLLFSETFELVVQINGKVRGKITVEQGVTEQAATVRALADAEISKWLTPGPIKKTIFVPGKLISFIV